ncbi:hypothetical protein QJQ45_006874 [Haematococcus lacustris]|nr:hypothetical protein QJQ45_006874 [Haematococcus lacustris]
MLVCWQGDSERAQGLAVSPLCDRTKQGITKSQVGFFDFVALPLFNNFVARFKSAKPLLRDVMRNYRHWQMEAEASNQALIPSHKLDLAGECAAAAQEAVSPGSTPEGEAGQWGFEGYAFSSSALEALDALQLCAHLAQAAQQASAGPEARQAVLAAIAHALQFGAGGVWLPGYAAGQVGQCSSSSSAIHPGNAAKEVPEAIQRLRPSELLAQLLWSASELGCEPDQAWLQAAGQKLVEHADSGALFAAEFCLAIGALGAMGLQPSPKMQDAIMAEALVQLTDFSSDFQAADLTRLISGLADLKLGGQISSDLRFKLMRAVYGKVNSIEDKAGVDFALAKLDSRESSMHYDTRCGKPGADIAVVVNVGLQLLSPLALLLLLPPLLLPLLLLLLWQLLKILLPLLLQGGLTRS